MGGFFLPGNFFRLGDGVAKYLPPFLSLLVPPRSSDEEVSACFVVCIGSEPLFAFALTLPETTANTPKEATSMPARKAFDIILSSSSNRSGTGQG